MSEQVIQQCAVMTDRELVRTLTIDRENFQETFLVIAESEREKRALSIEAFIDDVHLSLNDAEGASCTIDQALAKVHSDISLWSIITLTNCMEDAWVIQREVSRWLVHHYVEEGYATSFFFDATEQLQSTLRRFLSLELWTVEVSHDLNTWKPVFQSRSPAFLNKIILELGDILHTVKTPLFSQDQKGQLVLLVHPEFEKQAQEIVAENHTKIEQLYDRAEHLAETENAERELRIYDILSELVPDNLAVHYNRGNILLEQERLDEATESLIEAIVLGLPEIMDKVDLKPRRGSGVAGSVNPLLNLLVASQTNNEPLRYPDYIDDVEILLQRIREQRPENTRILHGLAIIAEQKNDIAVACQHYRDMLAIDPQNKAAQIHLAYLEQIQ
jgi:tetratricopeptide (TPR) repeat protein